MREKNSVNNKKNTDEVIYITNEILKSVKILLGQVELIKAQIYEGNNNVNLNDLYANGVYHRFQAFTEDGYIGTPPNNREWRPLESLIRRHFPQYYRLITLENRFTRDQLRLCMLICLSFPSFAIQKVMDVDTKRMSRLKTQINQKLFNDKRASTLEEYLKPYIDKG